MSLPLNAYKLKSKRSALNISKSEFEFSNPLLRNCPTHLYRQSIPELLA